MPKQTVGVGGARSESETNAPERVWYAMQGTPLDPLEVERAGER